MKTKITPLQLVPLEQSEEYKPGIPGRELTWILPEGANLPTKVCREVLDATVNEWAREYLRSLPNQSTKTDGESLRGFIPIPGGLTTEFAWYSAEAHSMLLIGKGMKLLSNLKHGESFEGVAAVIRQWAVDDKILITSILTFAGDAWLKEGSTGIFESYADIRPRNPRTIQIVTNVSQRSLLDETAIKIGRTLADHQRWWSGFMGAIQLSDKRRINNGPPPPDYADGIRYLIWKAKQQYSHMKWAKETEAGIWKMRLSPEDLKEVVAIALEQRKQGAKQAQHCKVSLNEGDMRDAIKAYLDRQGIKVLPYDSD